MPRAPRGKKKGGRSSESRTSGVEINPQFRRALDLLEGSSRHVFITGRAGTGKSTLLEHFRDTTLKRVAVLAPTGVAALNVRGQTIHSFCRFKPGITPDTVRKLKPSKPGGSAGGGRDSRDANIYKKFETVIIDEVSMVRADLLDCVEKFLRLNGPDSGKLFGGLQMVFIGDLYQLPPVVTSSEKGLFSGLYETPYFFSARVFRDARFSMELVELEKVYRQSEEEFIGLLNAIRNRTATDADLARLNENCDPDFVPAEDEFYITLTSTNDLASGRNREQLAR
ncbi:MAG: AAA family ATPase, partial [Candidatus Aminicenantes bacterium]|nr:AAA family ATPase [Candidatus Aminicenantes bacterium]